MKVAICGYPPLAKQMQEDFKDIEFKFFIKEFVSLRSGGGGGYNFKSSPDKFF